MEEAESAWVWIGGLQFAEECQQFVAECQQIVAECQQFVAECQQIVAERMLLASCCRAVPETMFSCLRSKLMDG